MLKHREVIKEFTRIDKSSGLFREIVPIPIGTILTIKWDTINDRQGKVYGYTDIFATWFYVSDIRDKTKAVEEVVT